MSKLAKFAENMFSLGNSVIFQLSIVFSLKVTGEYTGQFISICGPWLAKAGLIIAISAKIVSK
ncbi:unnamed protein product [Meloidogyne enterolobii]|uniref:Uncharacterized protein n=1 Tax=Meloidogyne enterolobii TaxID=390850 RepID=A0ACB0ZG98_MELEN